MLNKTVAAMLLAPLAMVSLPGAAWATDKPVHGVVIIVQPDHCPPGCGIRTRTGRDGRFVIEGMTTGTYTISVAASVDRMPPNVAHLAINTARSNINRLSSAMVGGVEVVSIEAESGQGQADAVIMIGAPRGRVTGVVTRAGAGPR
jgi:hypothetical protein